MPVTHAGVLFIYITAIGMLLTNRLILLQISQKLDKTALNCNKKDFNKTKWKAEIRYSTSDKNVSMFPFKTTEKQTSKE